MAEILYVLASTFLVSLLGLVGVFSLWIKKNHFHRTVHWLVAFSAGSLIGGAFFHLLAESVEKIEPIIAFSFSVSGFVVFLLIEGFFHSHFCEKCEAHPFVYTMLIGDAVHNFIDGLIIAASFIVSPVLGFTATIMIISHETPQEIGLFGTLIYGKFKRGKALFYSFAAQSTVILGGIAGIIASSFSEAVTPFIIPFAAGGFIYIASSDLVPEMHKMYEESLPKALKIILAFGAGITLMILIKLFFEG